VALEITVAAPDASSADLLGHLRADGGVIVPRALSADLIDRFKADIAAPSQQHSPGASTAGERMTEFWGSETKRFTRLAWRSPAFEEILLSPTLMTAADELLLPSCDDYWLNTGQMMIIGPGETKQMHHRDAGNWPHLCTPDSPEVTVSAMYAISDFTAENGATRVVPGSHLWRDYAQAPTAHQFCTAEMSAGDCLLYTGRVIHNGGANVTGDEWRFGLHVSFVLGWLTPEEALPLATPWSAAGAMSERAQRLLGWKSYGERSRLWTVDYEEIRVALDREDRMGRS